MAPAANLVQRLRSQRATAIPAILILTFSAVVALVVVPLPAGATSTSPTLFDDFTHDASLNVSLWQVNGPVGMQFGQEEVGVNTVTLAPTFSSKGMMIDQINASQEEGTIQSIANFTPPFTATATVDGTVSNGHTFGFATTSADASSGITVYGNLNPQNCSHLGDCGDPSTCGVSANSAIPPNQCYYGIDGKVGTNGSSWAHYGKLYLTPSVNITYTLQISVDASGNAWYAVSQGGKLLGAVNKQVGTGPFWLIMYQGEGSPVEGPGPNQAYWMSVSVNPTFTTFLTTSTSPSPTAPGISIYIWIIMIIVVVILFLIILLWSRRRNLTIKVQDARTLTAVTEAAVSADGPEKLRGYTDKDGEITFRSVKNGDFSIEASAKGYNPSVPVKIPVKKTTEYTVKLDRVPSSAQGGAGIGAPPGGPSREFAGKAEAIPGLQGTERAGQGVGLQTQQPQAGVTEPTKQGTAPENAQPETVASSPGKQEQEEPEGFGGGRIGEIIRTFQAKGAISPETALTAEELGLSRLFVRVMKRRKGRTRIFVEINGRYYLDQKALRESI